MDGAGSDAPPGFVQADLGAGYGAAFGPVWMDRPRSRIGFRVAERHANPVGACHGGAMATFADAQLIAVRGGREEGRAHTPTVSLSVDYLSAAQLGEWVEAQVELIRETPTLLFVQSVIRVGNRPVARTSAIYRNRRDAGPTNGE